MPRTARIAPAGVIFHVLNRANGKTQIFGKAGDYRSFRTVLSETCALFRTRLLAYCIMPNHWHLVLWPRADGELGMFMQRLTTTHVRRWHLHRQSVGMGHLYQGTYKSFPVQDDAYLLQLCRYVERNPLRAKLVSRAEDWRWSSLRQRLSADSGGDFPPLSTWPVERPADWIRRVNQAETAEELELLRMSVVRSRPFGVEGWQKRTANRLGLNSTFRLRGRPRKRG